MEKFDNIFLEKKEKFVFDKEVAGVFDNMISRSIPGYEIFLKLTGLVSKNFIKDKDICYDFGASLLKSTKSVIEANKMKNFKVIAVDNSEAMSLKVKPIILDLKQRYSNIDINFLVSDVCDIKINKFSFGILNFILQFLPKNKKLEFLKNIFNGLEDGGGIILSEKIIFENENLKDFYTNLYFSYKKSNGYSDAEIKNKKEALKGILIPESLDFHIERLKNIGFTEIRILIQILNFVSILAIK